MNLVVNQLQSAAQQLPRDERQRLGELVNEWEYKYGNAPHLAPPIGQPGTPEPSVLNRVRATQPVSVTEQPLSGAITTPDLISPDSSLVQSLLTLYIRMRRQGQAMDDVVNKLQDSAQQLSRDDRHQLGELVTEWEDKFGRYLQAPAAAPQFSSPQPAQPPPLPPRPSTRAFGTRMLDQSKIEALVLQQPTVPPPSPITCPNCSRVNPVGSLICASCGQPLQTKPVQTTRRLDDSNPKKGEILADYFSQDAALLIAIRGNKSVLEAFPRERLVIGRGLPKMKGQPFLDLTPYDGEAMGVSRNHAEIRFVNNTLVVTDLDSDNGTYINDIRLYPHEIRVLHNNDVLRVGKLDMKLSFRLPLRS